MLAISDHWVAWSWFTRPQGRLSLCWIFSPRALFSVKLAEESLLWRDHISHCAWFPSVSALERVGSLYNRPSLRLKYLLREVIYLSLTISNSILPFYSKIPHLSYFGLWILSVGFNYLLSSDLTFGPVLSWFPPSGFSNYFNRTYQPLGFVVVYGAPSFELRIS